MITNSAQQTQKIGYELAQTLKGGEVICLYGDLGYGKTTFTQGIAKGLGIEKRITSPTFVIVRQYEISDKRREVKAFYHYILYALNHISFFHFFQE